MKKLLTLLFGASDWKEVKKRGLKLAILVPIVHWFDWLMLGATGAAVDLLEKWGLSTLEIFFFLWAGNIILSGMIVWLNDNLDADILLMEALRRGVNSLIAKSPILGYLAEAVLIARLVIWDGPDNFILFFRERLASRLQKVGVFVFVSGLQMAVWTMIYVTGLEALRG